MWLNEVISKPSMRLPLQMPLREAVGVYLRRLGIFLAVVLANILLLIIAVLFVRGGITLFEGAMVCTLLGTLFFQILYVRNTSRELKRLAEDGAAQIQLSLSNLSESVSQLNHLNETSFKLLNQQFLKTGTLGHLQQGAGFEDRLLEVNELIGRALGDLEKYQYRNVQLLENLAENLVANISTLTEEQKQTNYLLSRLPSQEFLESIQRGPETSTNPLVNRIIAENLTTSLVRRSYDQARTLYTWYRYDVPTVRNLTRWSETDIRTWLDEIIREVLREHR